MRAILEVVLLALNLYVWILIVSAVFSWLVAFNVVNMRNQFVAMLAEALWRLTEPALRPIRRILPSFGGLDLSPVVLILLLSFVLTLISRYQFGLPL